jgi:carotenoid cleavage dioxygenase
LKQILSILLGFMPWIVFGAVSGPTLFRLNAAVIAALVLLLVMGFKQLAKGFVLTWGSLLFFGVILVMVVWLRNAWFIGNLDILAHGTLAAIAWLSIFMGKPFVLQYALETVPPERQASPIFHRICRNLTAIWGVVFIISTGMSTAKAYGWLTDGLGVQAASLGLIGLGLWLNHWYPQYVRRGGQHGRETAETK